MKVRDLFEVEAPTKVVETKDPTTMSKDALELELMDFDEKEFKNLEKWERGRKAALQAALNKINSTEAEAAKQKIQIDRKNKISKKEVKELLMDVLYDKAMDSIANSFPDGDPIDSIMTWMDHNDLDMSDLDKVMRKHERKSFNKYLADMWSDYSKDAIADAKSAVKAGKDPYASSLQGFFKYDKETGKITPEQNPWKTK